jgi:UDPglucose 6-dehydrogenase
MRIAMIGSGYVGLVTGTCMSEFGFDVVCVDKDAAKISALNLGEIPIFEPGLTDLVQANADSGHLTFSTDLAAAVAEADAVFIAVGTPSRHGDGFADLSYVYAAAEEIAPALRGYTVVVDKSTVPVGTSRDVAAIICKAAPNADFDVVSNPEFLREGSAINDFMRPDRVVVGAETDRAQGMMEEIYRPLFLHETPILMTTLETAELTKYAANAFLAAKVTFINEIASLCEIVGADVQDVARGMGFDRRIGAKFLHAGPGFGGSCFPKDTLALVAQGQKAGSPVSIVEAVVQANDARKVAMGEKIIAACGGSVDGKTLAVLGLTFKPNTDDMREAPSLVIVPALQAAGATVRAYDPEGMTEAKPLLPDVTWCEDAYDAMDGADALVIITEWNAFRSLDLDRATQLLNAPIMVDLRNIYSPEEMAAAGFAFTSIGRTDTKPATQPRSVTSGGA